MPQEVRRRLQEVTGLPFMEAYGMPEAAATTHINPIEWPKPQCLGAPFFDTGVGVVHPETLVGSPESGSVERPSSQGQSSNEPAGRGGEPLA